MTHTANTNNAGFKKAALSGGIVALILFCAFVVFYEARARGQAHDKIDQHVRVIADALWNYNYDAVSEYLNLACQSYDYATLSVFEVNGSVFYESPPMAPGPFERLLMAVNLIPEIRLESHVDYDGRTIGRIEAVWNPRTVYTHGVVLAFFIMGLALFLFYARLFQANQTLEMRVRERTSSLAGANTALQYEIREREQIEKKLRQNEENLRTTLDSIGDAVIATDIGGQIVRMNPVAQALTGWRIEEAVGRLFSEVFYIVDARTKQRLADPVRRVLDAGGVVELAEHTLLLASDGKEYRVDDSGAPIRDRAGHITGVVLVFRDISEDYRMREALRESETQLRRAQAVARMGSWQVDLNTGRVTLTEEACRIYGMDACDNRPLREIKSFPLPEYREMLDEKLNGLLHGEQEYEVEYRIKRPADGQIRDIYSLGAYNPESNTVTGTIQDITERKQAEAELQKVERLKTVGMLAGGIAHDFNNILTGIFGSISLAKSKLESGHAALNPLEEGEKSMERAIRLTNQLLTFSKGGYPVKEDARLDQIVEEVVRFDLSGSNVKPVFESSGDLWLARVDKGQVQQVFSNLAINANQAMPEGGHLHISLENAHIRETSRLPLSPGRYIKAVVRDDGVGIEQKHLGHIFDPYYSIRQNGTGLGLATVYSIMERHGGYIHAASEPGKGATFTLYLPASETQPPPESGGSASGAPNVAHSARVLVMDDEEMIRNIASEMLQAFDCEVKTAADGKEAVAMYKEAMASGAPFGLVIMDMTVPGGMGGVEALKEILAFDPGVRAVVSSGYTENAILGNFANYGFKDILSKPYTLERLRAVLNRVLQV